MPQKTNGPTVLQGFDEDSGGELLAQFVSSWTAHLLCGVGARMRPILSSDMSFADQQETNFKRGVRRAANTIDRFRWFNFNDVCEARVTLFLSQYSIRSIPSSLPQC